MIINPEPNLRPLSIRPGPNPLETARPLNPIRSRSTHQEFSNPTHLPIESTIEVPPNPDRDNPRNNDPPTLRPETHPKKKQRIHATVSAPNPATIRAPAVTTVGDHPTEEPTTDESIGTSQASDQSNISQPIGCSYQSERLCLGTTTSISFSRTPFSSYSNHGVPPRSAVNHHLRPWTDNEDHELISYKSDTRARPTWKTIGLRLKRDPEVCEARWLVETKYA
jgi:hypothetical protein